jgi:FdhE protein
MRQESSTEKSVETVAAALRKLAEENAHLEHILDAFGGLLIEQTRWKAELTDSCRKDVIPDPERFGKGVPLSDRIWLIGLGPIWKTAAEQLLPSLVEGFGKISGQLKLLQNAVKVDAFSPDLFMDAALGGREKEAMEIAGNAGIQPEILLFALTRIARPVVEKRAEILHPLVRDLPWSRGYCPICGSLPAMSLLRGKEGHRWLRCGFCSTTWKFYRTTCPFCDSQDPADGEIFFVEDRQNERIEACHKCKRYLIGMDMRNLVDEPLPEVAEIGLMHLDAIAQEKGFLPLHSL